MKIDGGSRVSRHEAEHVSGDGVASGATDMPFSAIDRARLASSREERSSAQNMGVVTDAGVSWRSSFSAVGLVAAALALGWLIMWRVILRKIPILRVMCDLPELSPKSDKSD